MTYANVNVKFISVKNLTLLAIGACVNFWVDRLIATRLRISSTEKSPPIPPKVVFVDSF